MPIFYGNDALCGSYPFRLLSVTATVVNVPVIPAFSFQSCKHIPALNIITFFEREQLKKNAVSSYVQVLS